ncbi:MAG TPA: serine/threonine-protein kinase [Candidatus Acidoferrum sp.]|nr:serine/threonine-protein kinase [Candidatus Acidoferrum sp.]
MSSLVNALIGEYLVTDFVGEGGMGEVYKATHTHIGRVIAIKVLSQGVTDPNTVRRFYDEAGIQASLRHPGVAEYLGFYEYRGRPCILMEFVDGETIASILNRRGAIPPSEAFRIACATSEVVAHFHKNGVLHRDIKSGNVKINSAGAIKVLDFGIARFQNTQKLTSAGMVIGTPGILAPEQVRGREVTPATDVWQLGILMYEMLTGKLPFGADNPSALYAQILNADYPPVSRVQTTIAPSFEKALNRCLQKDPAKRFASGSELLMALQGTQKRKDGSIPDAKPESPVARKIPFLRLGVILGGAAVFIALAIGVLRGYHPSAEGSPIGACFEGTSGTDAERAEKMTVRLDTFEGSAQVFCKDQLVGVTPLTLQAGTGDKIHVVLRREGYKDLEKRFDVTERKVYTFVMERIEER